MTTLQVNSAIARPVSIGSGTVTSGQQTVTTSAVALSTSPAGTVTLKNTGASQTCFIGASNLTLSNGYALAAGQSVTLSVKNLNLIYCMASATGATLAWNTTY